MRGGSWTSGCVWQSCWALGRRRLEFEEARGGEDASDGGRARAESAVRTPRSSRR